MTSARSVLFCGGVLDQQRHVLPKDIIVYRVPVADVPSDEDAVLVPYHFEVYNILPYTNPSMRRFWVGFLVRVEKPSHD